MGPDRWRDGLQACIRSLVTVVKPAVDRSGDPLASEQVALVARYLDFLAQRIDVYRDRGLAILLSYAELADRVRDALARAGTLPDSVTALREAADRARAVGADPRSRPSEIEATTNEVKTELSRIVRQLGPAETGVQAEVAAAVTEHATGLVALGRAWFAPQRWENDADRIPRLEDILDRNRT